MNVIPFLLPAVGGFWFLSHNNVTRYRYARLSGYHLLFASAFVGTVLYGIAHVLLAFFDTHYPQMVCTWEDHSPDMVTATVQVSLLLAFAVPLFVNRVFPADFWAAQAAYTSGDLIELTIHRAVTQYRLVEVSLRSRKSYIGLPLESGPGSIPDSDVSLIPLYSGYRDKDTLELVLVRNYGPVVKGHAFPNNVYSGWNEEDFRIVFPMSEIVSVRLFNDNIFDHFQLDRPEGGSRDVAATHEQDAHEQNGRPTKPPLRRRRRR